MPKVQIEGVGVVAFPDTMSPAEIQKAIETEILPKKNKPLVGASPVDPAQASRDALEGVGPDERLIANLGAGIDTAWQGAKSLFGGGPSSDDLKIKRQRDAALAESTPLGAAVQFGGEMAPGLAIPGGAFVKGAQGAVNLARGAQAAPTALRLGGRAAIADAAIGGGVMGAAQATTDEESRLFNTVAGAVGGGVLPGLIAAKESVRELLTKSGAMSKAAERLVAAVGGPEKAEQVLAKLRSYAPGAVTRDIPMDVAEITQDPALARQAIAARTRFTEDWAPWRKVKHDEQYAALQKATADAPNVGPAKAARDAAADPLRDEALRAAEGADYTTPVEAAVTWMREGTGGANPAVKSITSYVQGELGNKNMSPERLYEVRKVLLKGLNGPTKLGDDLAAATKTARRETMALVQSIDEALDGATGGKWTPYLQKYASKSGEVDSATAQKLIRNTFDREGASATGGVPDVTGFRLGKAVEKHGENAYGDKLGPARGRIDELRENLDMSEGLMKLMRGTGTSGGGSNTAMDAVGVAASAAADSVAPATMALLRRLVAPLDKSVQAAMSDALRNPEVFNAAVSRKLAQRLPLTRTEEAVLALIRQVGSGAPLAAIEPRQ